MVWLTTVWLQWRPSVTWPSVISFSTCSPGAWLCWLTSLPWKISAAASLKASSLLPHPGEPQVLAGPAVPTLQCGGSQAKLGGLWVTLAPGQ